MRTSCDGFIADCRWMAAERSPGVLTSDDPGDLHETHSHRRDKRECCVCVSTMLDRVHIHNSTIAITARRCDVEYIRMRQSHALAPANDD